jgi:hypothetical protein
MTGRITGGNSGEIEEKSRVTTRRFSNLAFNGFS